MGSFRSSPASTTLLVGLLAWIAFVLVAPQIDLDDFAFRSKQSPLEIHALTCHIPHVNATISVPGTTVRPANTFGIVLEVFFFDSAVEVSSTAPRILRC